jgi:hypothetical protein
MVLSLMALLHDLIPCSTNIFKMKENYEKKTHEDNLNKEESKQEKFLIPIKRNSSYLASPNIIRRFTMANASTVSRKNSSSSYSGNSAKGEDFDAELPSEEEIMKKLCKPTKIDSTDGVKTKHNPPTHIDSSDLNPKAMMSHNVKKRNDSEIPVSGDHLLPP